MNVDRTLHYHGLEVLDRSPPALPQPEVDRAPHWGANLAKPADVPLPVPAELVPATVYDPWHRAAEIRSGAPMPAPAPLLLAPAAKVFDEAALRGELEDAQAIRADAAAEVDRYRTARARSAAQLDALVAEVEAARAERQAEDMGEVDRLREAALSGTGLALPAFGAVAVSEAERGVPVLQALVARLDGEVADHERALGSADDVVDRIASELMEAEAEVLAAELWQAKRRVAALHARLDGFTRTTPPHRRGAPHVPRRVELGGGNFIVEPDHGARNPPRFDPSLAVAKALNRTPGLDASGFPTGAGDYLTEGDAWGRYAAALRSDPHARPIPVTEPQEALR